MPNHVDEAENKSRNHVPLDMLGIPKPILGTNDEVKSSNADISSLVTTTFDLIENTIKTLYYNFLQNIFISINHQNKQCLDHFYR